MSKLLSSFLSHLQVKEKEQQIKAQSAWAELVVAVAEERKGFTPEDILQRLSVADKCVDDLDAAVKTYLERSDLATTIEELQKQMKPRSELNSKRQAAIEARNQAIAKHREIVGAAEQELTNNSNQQRQIVEMRQQLLSTVRPDLRASVASNDLSMQFMANRIHDQKHRLGQAKDYVRHPSHTQAEQAECLKRVQDIETELAQSERELRELRERRDELEKEILVPSDFLS